MVSWRVQKNHPTEKQFFSVYNKMILAVGDKEVKDLEERWTQFRDLFPTLSRIEGDEITKIEPLVMEGRDPQEAVLALSSPDGYTIDYGALSQSFVAQTLKDTKDKIIDIFYNTLIFKVEQDKDGYTVYTHGKKSFRCKVLIVSAGGHTPLIAQSLGYAKNYSILSVAGSFFNSSRKILNGKVYTMQIPKLPFAAVHWDPDVYNSKQTRFGPTAKGIFMLERYNYKSIREYFKVFGFRWKAFQIIIKLATDKIIWPYLLKNFWYDVPYFGKRSFIKVLKKVIPTITPDDIIPGHKLGGTRPQILNLDTMELEIGEAKIIWDKVIFNITPSPGATTCLANAYDDTQTVMGFFKGEYTFDKEEFEKHYVK